MNRPILISMLVFLAAGSAVMALDYTWDASGGAPLDDGAGSWASSGGANWYDGTNYAAWGNTTADTAIIGAGSGAAGTINQTGTININVLTFNAPGSGNYVIDQSAVAGANILSFGGTSPTINVNASATIANAASSDDYIQFAASSTLTMNIAAGQTLTTRKLKVLDQNSSIIVTGGGTLGIQYEGYNKFMEGVNGSGSSTLYITNNSTVRLVEAFHCIPDAVRMHIASGSAFDMNGKSEGLGYISGAGSLTNSGAAVDGLTLDTPSYYKNSDFSGVMSGSGGLTMRGNRGANTQILSGPNTYTGNTEIDAGTLLVNNSSGSGTGTGAVNVNSGGTLGGTGSVAGVVSVKNGGHISSAVEAGTLTLSSGMTLNDGSEIDVELDASGVTGDIVIGGGTLTGSSAGGVTVNVTGTTQLGTYTLMDWSAATESGVESSDFVLNPASNLVSLVVSSKKLLLIVGGPYTWDSSGGAPLDDGAGTWASSGGANWYNGTTYGAWGNSTLDTAIIGAGSGATDTIELSGTITLNSILFDTPGSGNYTLESGTLSFGGSSPTITVSNSVTFGNTNLISLGSGVSLNINIASNKTLNMRNLNCANDSIVTVSGGGTLELRFKAWNPFMNGPNGSGPTALYITNNSTVKLVENYHCINDNILVDIASGSTLDLNGKDEGVGYISGDGSLIIDQFIVDIKSYYNGSDFSGVISGTGPFFQRGRNGGNSNRQILSGTNSTYTGKTRIYRGILEVSSIKDLGVNSTIGAPVTIANGTIDLGGVDFFSTHGTLCYVGTGDTSDRVLNLNGTNTGGAVEQAGTGLLKFTSAMTATGVGVKTFTLKGSTAGTGEIGGAIVDSSGGATSLTKDGTGTWTISGVNTYTGDTTIDDGTLILGASNALDSDNNIILNGGTLDCSTFNNTVGILDVSAASSIISSGSGSLVFADSSAVSWSGTLDISGQVNATSIRFGTDSSGLTATQLSKITSSGKVSINALGYLTVASGTVFRFK